MRQLVLFLCAMTAIGQAPPAAAPPATSNPLIVRFQVEPKKGQPATDLAPADIEIREDGVPQPVVLFEGGRARTLPVHVYLVFDCERSALAGIPLEPALLQENLLNAHQNVAIGIYGFSGAPVRLTAPTRDPARLKKALDAAVFPHAATTFLFDHIQTVVLDTATTGPAIRMLVILSRAQPGAAGGPHSSERDLFDPTVRIAQESSVTVYPVLLRSPFGSQASDSNTTTSASARGGASSPNTMTEYSPDQSILRSVGDFNNLGSATGGHSSEALSNTNFLPGVLQWISKVIEDDYVAGFNPTSSGGGKRHKVQVVLRNKNRGKLIGGSINVVH
jgi:VWFA-related protein